MYAKSFKQAFEHGEAGVRFVKPKAIAIFKLKSFCINAFFKRKGTFSNYLLNLSYCVIKVACFLRLHRRSQPVNATISPIY